MNRGGLGGILQRDTIAKEVATVADRNAYPTSKRVWGMAITVTGDQTYRLKYNNTSVNKSDNGNWVTETAYVGTAVAGPDKSIQFNDNGVPGVQNAQVVFTYNKANGQVIYGYSLNPNAGQFYSYSTNWTFAAGKVTMRDQTNSNFQFNIGLNTSVFPGGNYVFVMTNGAHGATVANLFQLVSLSGNPVFKNGSGKTYDIYNQILGNNASALVIGPTSTEDRLALIWDNANLQYTLDDPTKTKSGSSLSYKRFVTSAISGAGAGSSVGITNPSPWANNSVVFVRAKINGVETSTPGASGFSYILEGTFIKSNAGVVTKIAAVTAADDLAKSQRNNTGTALAAANTLTVSGGSLFVDVFFAAAPGKNYNISIDIEYTYTV